MYEEGNFGSWSPALFMNLVTHCEAEVSTRRQWASGRARGSSLQMTVHSFRSMPTGAFSKRPPKALCKSQMGKWPRRAKSHSSKTKFPTFPNVNFPWKMNSTARKQITRIIRLRTRLNKISYYQNYMEIFLQHARNILHSICKL